MAAKVDECGEVIQSYVTEQAVGQTNAHPYERERASVCVDECLGKRVAVSVKALSEAEYQSRFAQTIR